MTGDTCPLTADIEMVSTWAGDVVLIRFGGTGPTIYPQYHDTPIYDALRADTVTS